MYRSINTTVATSALATCCLERCFSIHAGAFVDQKFFTVQLGRGSANFYIEHALTTLCSEDFYSSGPRLKAWHTMSPVPCSPNQAVTPITLHRLRWCKPFQSVSESKHTAYNPRRWARRRSKVASVANPISREANVPQHNGAYRVNTPADVPHSQPGAPGKRVVVVGGGWAGKALHHLISACFAGVLP